MAAKGGTRPDRKLEALEEARRTGAMYYHGSPCKHGHTLRFTRSSACVECFKTYETTKRPKYKKTGSYRDQPEEQKTSTWGNGFSALMNYGSRGKVSGN